jgi:hypothetical protein
MDQVIKRPSVVSGYVLLFFTQVFTGFSLGVGLVLANFVMKYFFKIGF